MKYKEFVEKAVKIFDDKKRKKEILKNRVFRGRAASSSSDLEDLLAIAIAESIPKKYSVFVDYPLSFKSGNKGTITMYPDISIIKDNILVGIVEFKIDLGYMKKEWINQFKNSIKRLQNSTILKYKENVGTINAKKDYLQTSKILKTCVVVLSSKNSHNRLQYFKKELKPFILMQGIHPNAYKMIAKDKVELILKSNNDWLKFIKYLKTKYR